MSNQPEITLSGDDVEQDIIIRFPEPAAAMPRDNVWITVHLGEGRPSASVRIVRTDEGMMIDAYPYLREDEPELAGTWVLDEELVEEVDA